ncbi:MAG: hypothetical protein QM783_20145 [Phycisphaerales bacterium]
MIFAALLTAALAQTSSGWVGIGSVHLHAQPPAAERPPAAADKSPQVALAARVAAVRAQTTVTPLLVLVPNERAFLNALMQWRAASSRGIFPILLDDGTIEARENVARFVRAFKPARVIRLAAAPDALPVTAIDTQTAVYATFGAPDEAHYLEVLSRRANAPGPLGVVACQADNPAGAALAAAYGQVLVITDPPAAPGADYGLSAADKLSATITAHLTVQKIPFSVLGDQIDAVTLCYDVPARVMVGKKDAPANPIPQIVAKPDEALSLTDIIGRETENNRVTRWAYAAQVTGNHAAAAYRAMCAIFLQPTSAAAFNGYERTGEFGKYNPADAVTALKTAGLTTTLLDRPSQSAEDWRQWSSGSFAAREVTGVTPPPGGALTNDLFLVNTMGNNDFFQLQPGLCYAGDVPFLSLPAVVAFNHSWSLQYSGRPTTVGGRWLDRGAYIYVGSVHEPWLSAFTTPNTFAKRLTEGWPLAAAARILPTDKFDVPGAPPTHPFSSPWRVAVLGDALWTLGPALKRADAIPTIAGSVDVGAALPGDLRARKYADALDTLCALGRESDAARLARASLTDEPDKIDNAAARRHPDRLPRRRQRHCCEGRAPHHRDRAEGHSVLRCHRRRRSLAHPLPQPRHAHRRAGQPAHALHPPVQLRLGYDHRRDRPQAIDHRRRRASLLRAAAPEGARRLHPQAPRRGPPGRAPLTISRSGSSRRTPCAASPTRSSSASSAGRARSSRC